jgi:hypothetical protein
MGVISWIIVGLIAGALGRLLLPGDDPGGFIVTILIGMAGALVGGAGRPEVTPPDGVHPFREPPRPIRAHHASLLRPDVPQQHQRRD